MSDLPPKLEEILLKLRRQTLLNVMLAAMDEMEHYNGQPMTSAICRALDLEERENDSGGFSWTLPDSVTEIEKAFA